MNHRHHESLFQEILENNRGRLVSIARTYSYETEFEDLLQEMLLQIWKGLGSFKHKSSIDTWCYRVALNTALTWKRTAGRNRKNIPRSTTEVNELVSDKTEEDYLQILDEFLQTLTDIEKAILLMYLDDIGNNEMAEIVGISNVAMRVRIHRIKQKLKDWDE